MKLMAALLITLLVSCSSQPDININSVDDTNELKLQQELTPDSVFAQLPDSVQQDETIQECGYGLYKTVKEVFTGERDVYTVIYFTNEMLADSVIVETPKEIEETGKIYHFKNYMLINEPNKGIHVFDNTVSTDPQPISFIKLPFNNELAMRDSVLYVDCYTNLVAIATENFESIEILKQTKMFYNRDAIYSLQNSAWDRHFKDKTSREYRIEFPESTQYNSEGSTTDESAVEYYLSDRIDNISIAVDYKKIGRESYSDTIYEYHYTDAYWDKHYRELVYEEIDYEMDGEDFPDTTMVGATPTTGTGGSMARFIIQGEYLYVINDSEVQLFDISDATNPTKWTKVTLSWDIETLYPFNNKIFVGSMSGMYIIDTKDKGNPIVAGKIAHVRSCDPVVADDDYAYVTLRGGSACGGYTNQLDVIDISDIYNPELVKTYSMQGPKGLALSDNILYVCDGEAGLKVYDVEEPESANLLSWVKDVDTYDVIVIEDEVTLVSSDGVRVYNSENPSELEELHFIKKQ